jgi:hypothetical protein
MNNISRNNINEYENINSKINHNNYNNNNNNNFYQNNNQDFNQILNNLKMNYENKLESNFLKDFNNLIHNGNLFGLNRNSNINDINSLQSKIFIFN